jgi:hypothetical protein
MPSDSKQNSKRFCAPSSKLIIDFGPLTRAERERKRELDLKPELDIDEAEPDDDSLGGEARRGC